MALAYYVFEPEAGSWDNLWANNSLSRLLAVLARDPLTAHLRAHLPTTGTILEAGCGLGQYVRYLRHEGLHVVGGDLSLAALQAHRREYPDSPLVGMDLRQLPTAADALACIISLGVVEHAEAGPCEFLDEFSRALAPGGCLLLSTPWINRARRALARVVRRQQAARRQQGAAFYQYAYARSELSSFLEAAGFLVHSYHPYSPAKGLREWFPAPRLMETRARVIPITLPVPSPGQVSGIRQLLYWRPVLSTFAHMVLVVAQKRAD